MICQTQQQPRATTISRNNDVSKCIPNYLEITSPLRRNMVLRQPTRNLLELQRRITLLRFFDQTLSIRISCDASTLGLGSRTKIWRGMRLVLRNTIVKLEREMMSIVFSCSKFHPYIYDQEFEVLNDLKSILRKNLKNMPARLERFLMRLQKYQFTMDYISGSKLIVADVLSNAPLKDNTPEIPEGIRDLYTFSRSRTAHQ